MNIADNTGNTNYKCKVLNASSDTAVSEMG